MAKLLAITNRRLTKHLKIKKMKKEKLQSLKEELFTSEELKSGELKELVEIIGGAKPGTGKSDDCSDAGSDQTGTNDSTKYRSDSSETGDTVRATDGCNDALAAEVTRSIENYRINSHGVISGELMNEQ
eukprot:TRINITY_DN78_c0_g1_i1.p2 TRINITY_DN78_c0_g1~~TRINITY_DN78_c0_g1_i1.p2  ORF type:complete len:129 (-),score=6.02 TRINITY_DN78_c0_g1_i1:519-905(-)